ncbi:MAG: histidine phosphatase family protein [Pseudomonadota bacterium]|jgi:probable phosphoglycerate mutase|nr:histidine phosphatase family protein [Pseudomonadota bacterium]
MNSPEWHRRMRDFVLEAGGLAPVTDSFYFLRHGETEHNKRRIIQTQHGVTLNDTGRNQARAASEILVHHDFVEIHASNLERTWETAEIVNEKCAKPLHKQSNLWERDWGDWAGQSNIDLNWGGDPENGETLQRFTLRTLDGFREVLNHGKEILIVAHGGNYAVLLAAFGLPLNGPRVVKNAEPIRLTKDSSGQGGWTATHI